MNSDKKWDIKILKSKTVTFIVNFGKNNIIRNVKLKVQIEDLVSKLSALLSWKSVGSIVRTILSI